jgi:hypothetical protein
MVVNSAPRRRDDLPMASVIETVDGEQAALWEAIACCLAKETASGGRRTLG